MSTSQNLSDNINNYLPAVLKENKSGWLIEYYVSHPTTNKLTRKQIRLAKLVHRYKSVRDARAHCTKMLVALNAKLAGGWNPFFNSEDARLYEKLNTVTELFLKEKRKELRENTMRSYVSFVKLLTDFTNEQYPELLASMFSKIIAVRYMEYIYNERNNGATTYNNHLKMARALFNWMKEKCYTKENPFDLIKPKARTDKTRILIPRDVRARIIADLQENNPQLLLLAMLVYTSMIRPQEIKFLKVADIDLINHNIRIDKTIAKNKNERFATINDDIVKAFERMNLERYPAKHFVFAENLMPGPEHVNNGYYSKRWDKMRKRLNLPLEMQLYSLRDTGMHEMLKSGIDNLSVMQHADHSSLEMTTRYANHYDPNLNETIYSKSPKF